MSNKNLAIISYITIIGWLVAYLSYKNQSQKTELVTYHLEQSFGLFIVSVILSVVASILTGMIPGISFLLPVIGLLQLILMVLGIINAANEALKPVPVIGRFFEKKISFLA